MKKALCFCLLLVALALTGCTTESQSQTQPNTTGPVSAPTSGPSYDPDREGKDVTLMVYMVGSDLEAKGGAGTNDLTEMADSGVDLSRTNVVVYAGGTRMWHNDLMAPVEEHTMLELTDIGFAPVSVVSERSMGEADCLAQFLNTAYREYPAKSFALVLWDHGNGPLIGYGLDMLHDNDSLTLMELTAALEASPFSQENPLAWIGFDACLMASAELACVVDDYASLLVASQEIEPSFGWNYSFLKDLGQKTPQALLTDLTEIYLDTCLAYYERKGYDHRDTTLACVDLSKGPALENAIEALFIRAGQDVASDYNRLAGCRVNTRALGRASTGSEYDLIDLYDMAKQLSGMYPQESAAICAVIEEMVIANATNTQGCCGLSLYYPFYNKNYFERSWGSVYAQLNAFPQYAAYLDSYSRIWLGNDFLENFASSSMPSTAGQQTYTLELTAQQAQAFAEGRYYILQREGDQLYTKIFSSGNVTLEGNILTANFDGQILYGRDGLGNYVLPIAQEHDSIGDLARYSVYVNLTNEYTDWLNPPEGFVRKTEGHRFHLTANVATKEIYKSALVPYKTEVQTELLVGGKIEDADLSQWSCYYFPQERHRYLTRYDNGVIKPVDQWPKSSYISAYSTRVGDGLDFFFAPLVSGEYYLVFEVEDTQGSLYCSELLPITATGSLEEPKYPDPVSVNWESGEEVLLKEQSGVALYLTKIQDYAGQVHYALKARNSNDFDVYVSCSDVMFDHRVWCPDGSYGGFTVKANSTGTSKYGFRFGRAAELGMMKDHSSIQFSLYVITARGDKTLLRDQAVSVQLTPQTAIAIPGGNLYEFTSVTRGVLAKQQLLFVKDGLKAVLLGFGGSGGDGNLVGAIRYENTSPETKYIHVQGMVMDGIFVECGSIYEIPAGMTVYGTVEVSQSDLELFMIQSPRSVALYIQFMEYYALEGGGGFSELIAYPLVLEQKGSGCSFTEGQTLLLAERGVRIALHHTQTIYDTVYWHCTVINNSGESINLSIVDVTVNGKKVNMDSIMSGASYRDGMCMDGQKTIFTVWSDADASNGLEVTFRLRADDLIAERFLWESTKTIVLNYNS